MRRFANYFEVSEVKWLLVLCMVASALFIPASGLAQTCTTDGDCLRPDSCNTAAFGCACSPGSVPGNCPTNFPAEDADEDEPPASTPSSAGQWYYCDTFLSCSQFESRNACENDCPGSCSEPYGDRATCLNPSGGSSGGGGGSSGGSGGQSSESASGSGKGIDSSIFRQIGRQFADNPDSPAGARDLQSLVIIIVQILLVAAASVAVIFLMIGGYRYVTAHGNEEQTEGAKKTISGAIIGLVVIILAFAVVRIIAAILVGGLRGTGL